MSLLRGFFEVLSCATFQRGTLETVLSRGQCCVREGELRYTSWSGLSGWSALTLKGGSIPDQRVDEFSAPRAPRYNGSGLASDLVTYASLTASYLHLMCLLHSHQLKAEYWAAKHKGQTPGATKQSKRYCSSDTDACACSNTDAAGTGTGV